MLDTVEGHTDKYTYVDGTVDGGISGRTYVEMDGGNEGGIGPSWSACPIMPVLSCFSCSACYVMPALLRLPVTPSLLSASGLGLPFWEERGRGLSIDFAK